MKRDDAPTKKPPPTLAHLPPSEVRFPPSPPPTMLPKFSRVMGVNVPPRPVRPEPEPEIPIVVEELRSAPVHEVTDQRGWLRPAPGSAPQPPTKRSNSPPPVDLAVGAESVRIAQAKAKAAVAAQEAMEREQARALKPTITDQLTAWLGTKRGKAALALAGTIASGAGWSQAREAVLAALGIESVAVGEARENRLAKRLADVETKATDQGIKLGELEKRIDRQKTTLSNQADDLIEIKRAMPTVVTPNTQLTP